MPVLEIPWDLPSGAFFPVDDDLFSLHFLKEIMCFHIGCSSILFYCEGKKRRIDVKFCSVACFDFFLTLLILFTFKLAVVLFL